MKKVWMIGCLLMSGVLLTGCRQMDTKQNTKETMQANSEEMQEAETTPYGKYPELVTYTLGKMSGENNSNMPDGDTYEDNAYTRYLRDMLNVQNEDVFEASDNEYDDIVSMAIETNDIPDIMVVSTSLISVCPQTWIVSSPGTSALAHSAHMPLRIS